MSEIVLDLSGEVTGIMIASMLENAGLKSPYTVLDIGTGKGRVVQYLRSQGIEAFGVDLRSVFPQESHFSIADARSLPFMNATFQAVTESLMLAQLKELDRYDESYIREVFGEIKRVLVSGGFFLSYWGSNRLIPDWGKSLLRHHSLKAGLEEIPIPSYNLYLFRDPVAELT